MMNLLILYHLLVDLTDEKDRLDAAMRVTGNPARQGDLKRQIGQLVPFLTEIGGEICACERHGTACVITAKEFDTHLHRAFKTLESRGGHLHCNELRKTK